MSQSIGTLHPRQWVRSRPCRCRCPSPTSPPWQEQHSVGVCLSPTGPCVNSRGKKKRHRGGNQKVAALQTWTCGLSCSSPSGTVLQPWIWRRAVRCPSPSWRWVVVLGRGEGGASGRTTRTFLSINSFGLVSYHISYFVTWARTRMRWNSLKYWANAMPQIHFSFGLCYTWYGALCTKYECIRCSQTATRNKFVLYFFRVKCFRAWQRPQYAPLSGNSLLSVRVWKDALISKLCSRLGLRVPAYSAKRPLARDLTGEQRVE